MNLNLLRTFAAVAENQSFSRAAESIHVSQPAVSRAVRELEEQLDIPLVERGRRQIRLTEAGAALFAHARAIFALEQAALADIRGRRDIEHGSLTMGASKMIQAYLLPELISRFTDLYPGVEVRILSDNTEAIERRLLAYEPDIAFVEAPIHDSRVELTFWRDDELVILAAPHHPVGIRRDVEPATLTRERWILREEGSGTRAITERLLREAGVEVQRMLEVGSNGALVQSVAAGLGIAMVSVEAARDQIALGSVRVVKLQGETLSRPLYRARLHSRPASPTTQAFEALVEAGLSRHKPHGGRQH
ncbi:LysR family transcriptional regulator [Spiribacter halobius]|uniref:LysR family transcriptional regulator n=1 Tax=Sediminicurvatus halobius TaxID=2182432 RepID=A0A2U2MX93_9GAMM|nr:LysR family transcriptional regulator [Spiribacter halobius]PWG61481.1 LysR family transcriptional regulator [Spiribacter halobius]UEX77981.1 LysR family transcriptional regulator [Spiribacter halobius]